MGLCDRVSPLLTGLVRFPLSTTSAWRVINSTHTGKQHLVLISSSCPLKSNAVVGVVPSLLLSLTSNMLSAAILLSGFSTLIALQRSTYHWVGHVAHCQSLSVFQPRSDGGSSSRGGNFNVVFKFCSKNLHHDNFFILVDDDIYHHVVLKVPLSLKIPISQSLKNQELYELHTETK